MAEQRQEVGAAEAGEVEGGALEGCEQSLFGAAEKVEPSDVAAVEGTGLGEAVKGANAGREVIETGEIFEVAAVAAAEDLTQVSEAVDGLLDGGEGTGCRAVPMFHPAVVTAWKRGGCNRA